LRLLADAVVIIHALFVVWVVLGGLVVLRRPRLAWWHLPAAVWGALIEFAGWICPLTPLEKWLRVRGGLAAYEGAFIAHYLLPILYPPGLARKTQLVLGLVVLAINLAVYGLLLRHWALRRRETRRA
jgi:hypothetical protein